MGGISRGIITGNNKAVTTSKRQARFKERMKEKGFTQLNVWVPPEAAADIKLLAEALRADFTSYDGELGVEIGPLRLKSNGRLCSAKDVIRWAEEDMESD